MSLAAVDRLERIRAALDRSGRVRVSELAAELSVSEMTIRRDLDLLAEDGLVHRVRGGALATGPQPFAARYTQRARAKERIAAKLADLIGEGGAIAMDASTTMQRLVPHLDHKQVTVVTNGIETFQALADRPGITALLTGGELDARTGSLVGSLAVRAARDVLLRRLFVSAAGVDPVLGSSEATLQDAEVKLALADVSADVVLAVDSSKLGQRSPARSIPSDRIALLVTELDPADARLDPYRDRWQLR
jgi:DeoR family fructose operon transcriptional repressor